MSTLISEHPPTRLSFADMEQLRSNLAAIGRDHVRINGNGSIGKTTHWWFGRWVNRFFANHFGCGKAANQMVCSAFVQLISNAPDLGKSYATLTKNMLEKAERFSGARPLSGRKAAKVLARILILAKNDIHGTDTDPNAMLYREDIKFDIENITERFGQESLPYARALVRRLANTRGALSKNEINDQLFLMMGYKHREIGGKALVKAGDIAMHAIDRRRDVLGKLQVLQDAIIPLRSSHMWEVNTSPASIWHTPTTIGMLESQIIRSQKDLALQKNFNTRADVIQEMGRSYGEDAVPYATEFMSLPLTTEEMLREEMRNTYERLQKDAVTIVKRELGVQGRRSGTILASFIDQITVERGPNPQPINQWMWSVLTKAAYDKAGELPNRPEDMAQSADVQMLDLL